MARKQTDGSYVFDSKSSYDAAYQWARLHDLTIHSKDHWWLRVDFTDPETKEINEELQNGFEAFIGISRGTTS
jgi:hypothetical protein